MAEKEPWLTGEELVEELASEEFWSRNFTSKNYVSFIVKVPSDTRYIEVPEFDGWDSEQRKTKASKIVVTYGSSEYERIMAKKDR